MIVPIGKGTEALVGIVTAIAAAFVSETTLSPSPSTNVYVVPVWLLIAFVVASVPNFGVVAISYSPNSGKAALLSEAYVAG
tara:strand:+ start:670 stop:912 length:243 start_codon:yes stop_codon:yes gene_type:complete